MKYRFHWSVYAEYARRALAAKFVTSPGFIVALLDGSRPGVVLDESEWSNHFKTWREVTQ